MGRNDRPTTPSRRRSRVRRVDEMVRRLERIRVKSERKTKMEEKHIRWCIERIKTINENPISAAVAIKELEAMQARINELETKKIGSDRLLQAIADELGCAPSSDILDMLARLQGAPISTSVSEAINSGDGTYRP